METTRAREQSNLMVLSLSPLAPFCRISWQICEDKRKRRKKRGEGCADDSADDTFVTHPQMTLTFWLHEPVSKAAFKIFGPLFLVLVLMLVGI